MALDNLDLPEPAGSGRFLGLKPQDFLGMLGAVLGGVSVGQGPLGGGIRPFQALFPLAQGFENRDQDLRRQQLLRGIKQDYGKEDLPEFGMALRLINGGDLRGGLSLLSRGIAERNAQAKEDRKNKLTGQAALGATNALRPITTPGLLGSEDMTEVEATERAPSMTEIIDRLNEIATGDLAVGGLAAEKMRSGLETRSLEESKLRPQEELKGDAIYRKDPRTGTLSFVRKVSPKEVTDLQRAQTEAAQARARRDDALAERAQRDPNAPAGTEANPHIKIERFQDPNGVWQKWEVRSFTKRNPQAPGGFENVTQTRPLGQAPWKPSPPRPEGGGVKETLSTEEKITPRKRITDEPTFRALQGGVQDVVNEVTNKFRGQGLNFAAPGSFVTLPSGQKVRKEDVLAKAFKARHGVETTLVWDGSQFRITQAWAPETREPISKRRVVGPAGTIKQYEPDTDEEEE